MRIISEDIFKTKLLYAVGQMFIDHEKQIAEACQHFNKNESIIEINKSAIKKIPDCANGFSKLFFHCGRYVHVTAFIFKWSLKFVVDYHAKFCREPNFFPLKTRRKKRRNSVKSVSMMYLQF